MTILCKNNERPNRPVISATPPSPFHAGEQALQSALGIRDNMEKLGSRVIRDHMTEQHRSFYSALPYVFLGSLDAVGRPWASMLTGQPGFMQTPDSTTLKIDAWPSPFDAITENLKVDSQLGLLGVDFARRRRNRLSGHVTSTADNTLRITTHQSFGNCPMYIQARQYQYGNPNENISHKNNREILVSLDAPAKRLIEGADNFLIASHYSGPADHDVRHGVDVSHRGGNPGFVKVNGPQSLTFPDFRGNRHFNTLGNILMNGQAGLLFLDYSSGDALQLTGGAVIDEDKAAISAFKGAERLVHFSVQEAVWLKHLVPGKWQFVDASPVLSATGSWVAN